jgi:rare lipoprotein A
MKLGEAGPGASRYAICGAEFGPLGSERSIPKILAAVTVALFAANCGSQQKIASNGRTLDPKYGVYASPRVVEEGQPVPKGGGREMVGRPYQVAGRTYVPRETPGYSRVGLASWYGSAFHGRLTANGEIFDRHSIAAAHTTMPLPSYARVTNLENKRSIIVRVNDRGPYHANRVLDVSEGVAEALEFRRAGTARVRVDYVGRASTRGSDDRKLLATLRTDGAPAPFPGATAPIMLADAEPAPRREQAFAVLNDEARRDARPVVEAPAVEARPMQAPLRVSPRIDLAGAEERAPAGRLVSGIPLPPERPFDLGTIPNAGAPIAIAPIAQLPPRRPAVAGMFYASPDAPTTTFKRDDPFRHLKPQRFVALKAVDQDPVQER